MTEERDIESSAPKIEIVSPEQILSEDHHYTPDQQRAASYICEVIGVGGGDDPIGFLIATHANLSQTLQDLRAAARAVVNRWDTPLWKDVEPTADVINRLRDELDGVPHAAS